MDNKYHETVLVREIIYGLNVNKGENYIDATLGNGGHTLEILRHGGRVLGIDVDPQMIKIAKTRLEENGFKDYILVEGNFTDIDKIATFNKWNNVSGILFDLGVTNLHLQDLERGFSFGNPKAPLDMRLDPKKEGVKASDLLNALREDQLRDLFEITLDPGAARWVTGRVIRFRESKPINTVNDLLEIGKGLRTGKPGLNESTLIFLALRIAVNSELTNLDEALPKAFDILSKGGRLAVISFHSKEDVLVKNFFKSKENSGSKQITFKPIIAGLRELSKNRKARSAKLRILEK